MLTSAQKKVDAGVTQTIKLTKDGKYKGGVDGLFNVKNGGVGYGKVSTNGPGPRRADRQAEQLGEADRDGQGQAPDHRQRLADQHDDEPRGRAVRPALCRSPPVRSGRLTRAPTGRRILASMADAPRTVLEMRHITKRFPGIVANDDVDFDLREGEVHALLGENGAGKSTLMNILYGLYHPDEGEIEIGASRCALGTPSAAIDAGVGMVHQHFMLIPVMTVAENIVLAVEPTHAGILLDLGEANERVREISERFGLAVDPRARSRTSRSASSSASRS